MFPCSNEINVLKVVLHQVHAKISKYIWYLGKPFIIFHSQCFQKSLCCVLIQFKNKFQNHRLLILSKTCYVQEKFLLKSQKEWYIFNKYTSKTKLFTNVYYQKEGNLFVHISSAHINQSKSQKCVNIQAKIQNSK